jgi:hypothetical protein
MPIVRPKQPGRTQLSELEVDETTTVVDSVNNRLGVGLSDPKTRLTVEGSVTLKEQASADGDTAAYGQLWVKTATPNELYFTTDAGNDIQITSGTSTAFVGDITAVTAGVGLSGGGSSGDLTLTLDLSELSDVTPANGDKLATLDSDGANEQLTTVADLATLFAGTGLTASNSVIGVDASQTQITAVGTIGTGVWQGTAIAQAYIANDAINGDKIADDAINSEHYTDGSIDTAHIADNQVTLAKMAGITRGSIIIGNASGDPALLAAGSNNYVLTSDGTDIAWAEASGGGSVDLNGLSAAVVDVAADSIAIVDANDSNASRKESIADFVSAIAGNGLSDSNGVINLDAAASATGLAAAEALPGGAADSAGQIIAIHVFS